MDSIIPNQIARALSFLFIMKTSGRIKQNKMRIGCGNIISMLDH
jgi:hypothetical protein